MCHRLLEEPLTGQTQNMNTVDDEFCLIRCSDKNDFDIVPKRCFSTPSNTIEIYQTYPVEINGNQCEATVILKGTKEDCERLQHNIRSKPSTDAPTARSDRTAESNTEQSTTITSSEPLVPTNVNEESNNANDDDEGDQDTSQNNVFMGMLQMLLTSSAQRSNNDDTEIHKVRCGLCGTSPIKRDRYKCLNCEGLDMCGRCFARRKESGHHKSGHAFAHFKSPGELFDRAVNDNEVTFSNLKTLYANEIHESINCNGCNRGLIKGLRFKCYSCSNYNLCQQCVDSGVTTQSHKLSHSLIVVMRRTVLQIPVEDIQISNQCGRGAFGSVHMARWISKKRRITCKTIALPSTENTDKLEKNFVKDLAVYAELSGVYILKTYGYAILKQDENIKYMVIMEYMSRGSLSNVIRENGSQLSLRRRLDMARNIASGMRYIHEHQMIHRDIQPYNILVNENDVAKIGGMGIARLFDPRDPQTQISSQSYMPPEYYHGIYDETLDIFTFGLTLNEIFTSTKHSFETLPTGKISFHNKSTIFYELISKCVAYDPKRRSTAIEIEKTLDVFGDSFNELVLMKHPSYMSRSTKEKDKIFIAFYEKLYPHAMKIIEREFPPERLDVPRYAPGIKIDRSAGKENLIQYSVQ
ncbi:unnamed protein product [Rotaria magnacalcarata]|uniref:Uncharacterized protein n=3 Tax=Rotaria magnacalcarata TaxID=392030 RepID=A0A816QRE7_9BILA|nr:unnamed protein product [Rotaria magnacalcarata]